MAQSRVVLRVLLVLLVALGSGYWAASATSSALERRSLEKYGVSDFTQVPEYQGVGAAQLVYAGLVFLLTASLVGRLAWRVSAGSSTSQSR